MIHKKRVWFDVTDGNMHKEFSTLKEARAELKETLAGYPMNKNMTAENRAYWKKHGIKMFITKVVQTTTVVK